MALFLKKFICRVLYVGIIVLFLMLPALAQNAQQPERTTEVREDMSSVIAQNFMVVAANPYAAKVGYDILRRGGTAADAAVAVQIMLNLVEPQSSGIGGGAFALYWDALSSRQLTTFDGRETAPASATPDYWIDPKSGNPMKWWDAVVGGRSVGVPGTLKLLETLHRRYGRLNWSSLLEPAIVWAEKGFPISPRLAQAISQAKEKHLALFPETRDYFFHTDGTPKSEGQILRNPAFAKTLRMIARQGSQPFYKGDIAADIVQATRTHVNQGEMQLDDLAAYRVIERAPLCTDYRKFEICGMPPPTSGGVAIAQIMGMLSHFDLSSMGPSIHTWHLLTEAERLAYADRAQYLGDADFVPVPVNGLIDQSYLAQRAKLINPIRATRFATFGLPPNRQKQIFSADNQTERPGTSHFVIVDQYGNMISMTSTIETGFGSRVMTRGFLLNNELTDFSRVPEKNGLPVANRVEGGKRPRSSMSPTIVFKDQKPYLLIGSPGGSRIIGYVAQALVAILDFDMDPQEAVNLGHVINRNGLTELEEGTDIAELKEAMEAIGHEVKLRNLNSGIHAILISKKAMAGAADPRREGIAIGK